MIPVVCVLMALLMLTAGAVAIEAALQFDAARAAAERGRHRR